MSDKQASVVRKRVFSVQNTIKRRNAKKRCIAEHNTYTDAAKDPHYAVPGTGNDVSRLDIKRIKPNE